MNRLLLLLVFFLFGGIWCDHRLSSEESQYWKANCGTKPHHSRRFESRRIAGGQPIQGDAAPWAVLLESVTGSCSGTIISPRHVLTVSHCLMANSTEYDYRLQQARRECSDWDWISYPGISWFNIKNSYGKLLSNKVSRVIMMNYCYQPNNLYDDMMILELSENIQLDDYAYPACVSSNPNFQEINNQVRITAYGHNSWYWFNDDGLGTYMLRSGVFQIFQYYNDGRFMWLSGQNSGVNTRPGDSGGSVILYENGRYYVIGAFSYGYQNHFWSGVSSVFAHHHQICKHTGIC
ncbi:hypothetical protein B9Z55_015013 [Caenorhabditis nigoni]|uniref:Peptidase S1 domain-containing protein n=1 Tax=Caenorhabditis nigoni TaxID=1611254 RepID=A0A2G5U8C1_9PELO|nr:hypothetical protein B9Z55_015013 [Caenorhabditis nigoni]